MANEIEVKAPAGLDVMRELPDIFRLAKGLLGAGDFVPAHLNTEGKLVAAILAGRELGFAPMTSLRAIYIINGKVGIDASYQLAVMQRAGIAVQWVQSDEKAAILRLTRAGNEPHEQTYTMADADRAGLSGKGPWKSHPKAMLRARCVSAAAKAYAADLLAGVYTPDELDEIRENSRQAPRNDNALPTTAERAASIAPEIIAALAAVNTAEEFERVKAGARERYKNLSGDDKLLVKAAIAEADKRVASVVDAEIEAA